jgi:hypothetical protein
MRGFEWLWNKPNLGFKAEKGSPVMADEREGRDLEEVEVRAVAAPGGLDLRREALGLA